MTNIVEFFNWLHEHGGDIVQFQLPRRRHVAVFEANLVREVLVDKASDLPPFNPVTSSEVIQAEVLARMTAGDKHDQLRSLVASAFTRERVQAQAQIAEHEARRLAESLSAGPVEIRSHAEEFAYRVLARIVIGAGENLGPQVLSPSLQATKLNLILFALPGYGLLRRLPLPHDLKARKAIQPLDEVTYREIDSVGSLAEPPPSILGHLVRADGSTGRFFESKRRIRDELYAILLGAVDGLVHILTLAPYYLGLDSTVRDRLEDEVDRVQSVRNLRYARAVVLELLRLEPPSSILFPRIAVRDIMLGGFLIPKGTLVDVGIHAMHRRADTWEAPDSFRPERWLAEDGTLLSPPAGFMPFSIAPKLCQGVDLAPTILTAALTALVRRWRLEFGGTEFPPAAGLQPGLFSGGVTASLTAR